MVQRRHDNFHWPLFLSALAILAIGLVNLFSATHTSHPGYFFSQLIWAVVAILAGTVIYAVDYRIHERLATFLFIAGVVLLVLVFLNRPIGGSRRWVILGPARLQPSELMKVLLALMLAKYFHNRPTPEQGYTIFNLRMFWVILFAPVLLVLLEPDLGTALMLGFIGFTILMFVKLRPRTILILLLIATISIPIAWNFVLKPYQKQRIMTLFDPDSDPRGTGYHRRQSIIAVGSGQMTGKGFQNGTQTQLRFLPEQHTDFIFSVWAEEQGFVGSAGLLILYLIMIMSGIHIASKAREKFGAILAVGVTSIIFWQVLVNIGMVIGVLPVVGVTLPLMSYGGTSLVVSLICIGVLLNIYARRRLF